MIYLNVFIFLIIIIFLIFFCIFLFKGNNIYELLVYSNVNFIYDKMEKDFDRLMDKNNQYKNLVFAVNNNYIYKMTSASLNLNALLNQFYITNNNHNPILDIEKDEQKIIPLISNLSPKFDFSPFKLK